MTRNIFVAIFVGSLGTGCIDIDGDGNPDVGFGIDVCLGNFVEVFDGGTNWEVCVAIGDGNVVGSPVEDDGLLVEITSNYAEKAGDPNYRITQANVSCQISDRYRGAIAAASYVYTDGAVIYVYIPDVPSHFSAQCSGSLTFGEGGPADPLFVTENPKSMTTLVMWEDEAVGGWSERGGALTINN